MRALSVWLECELPVRMLDGGTDERVSLLLGVRAGHAVFIRSCIEVVNRASNRSESFRVLKRDVPDHLIGSIVGSVHTHPVGPEMPSRADLLELPDRWVGAVLSPSGVRWYARGRNLPVDAAKPL
jgi:proteasome lid subunit RPN8/RPN11